MRFDDLAAEGGWGLFAAAVPGAVRAIDVVETGDVGVSRPRSAQYSWQNIPEISFSHP